MARTTVEDVETLLEQNLVGTSNIQEWIDIAAGIVDTIEAAGQTENLERIEQLWAAHLIASNPKNEGHRRKRSLGQESGSVEFADGMDCGELAVMLDQTGTLDPDDDRERATIRALDSRGISR